jgi:hypothetical protein
MSEQAACQYCGSTSGCAATQGWPCTAERVEAIERRAGYGKPGDNRSYWD